MADLKPPLSGYSVWYLLAPKDEQRLQDLVDELAVYIGARWFRVHATLIGLLDYTDAQEDSLRRGTEELARRSGAPFRSEVIGIGMRDMYFQSVILPLVPDPALVSLNQAARSLWRHEGDPPLMPHISMVYGDFEKPMKQGAAAVIAEKLGSFPLTVTFDRLALVKVEGHPDQWQVVQEVPMLVSA